MPKRYPDEFKRDVVAVARRGDVVTPVVLDSQAAALCCAASARASAGVRSPSEACGRSVL